MKEAVTKLNKERRLMNFPIKISSIYFEELDYFQEYSYVTCGIYSNKFKIIHKGSYIYVNFHITYIYSNKRMLWCLNSIKLFLKEVLLLGGFSSQASMPFL